MRVRLSVLMTLALVACGYEVVDLAPQAGAPGGDVIIVGPVPGLAIDRFVRTTGGKADDKRLSWVYPADGVALPSDLSPLTFTWKGDKPGPKAPADKESEVYELRVASGSSALRVYTTETSYVFDAPLWRALLAQPDSVVTCSLRGLSTGGMARDVWDGGTRTLQIRAALPPGALYFEASGGIARARLADGAATLLTYPDMPAESRCLEGLSVSADGTRLSTACASATGGLFSLPALVSLHGIPADPARVEGGALDTNGGRLLEARASGLVVLDAATGALRETVGAFRASSPDWSPDGRSLIFAWSSTEAPPAPGPGPGPDPKPDPKPAREGTSIARVDLLADGTWSAPTVVVAPSAATGSWLRAPRYSPDGAFVAFEAGERADAMDDARLFVVRAAGGVPLPIVTQAAELPAMPMQMPMMDKRGIGSAPSWLPGDRADRPWLVFSASRELAGAKSKARQLWIAAVDLLAPEPGVDPSKPAFWLPAQDVGSDNRRARFAPEPP